MLLIIDNYDSFTYNLYQCLSVVYHDLHVVRNDCITIEDVKKLKPAGIVLSPGPGRPEQAGICIELLKTMGNTTPMLGVCLGHQAIVVAFGGKIIQAPEIVHGKHEQIFHNHTGIYQTLSSPFQAGRYHSLIADKSSFPDILTIEAENKNGLIMGIRHKHLPIIGVQFHPESILTPEGDGLLKNFVQQCVVGH